MTEWYSYTLESPYGAVNIVWRRDPDGPRVHRVLLPCEVASAREHLAAPYPSATPKSTNGLPPLLHDLARFVEGHAVTFDLDLLALETCRPFQRSVLLAEAAIPRGWVSTYGLIAAHLGKPGGARAVGRALATNPFPLIIPCHRAIRSDGSLGGFRGGLPMKRALLERESVPFTSSGRVRMERVHYR